MSGVALPAGSLIPPKRRYTLAEKVVQAFLVVCAFAAIGALGWVLRFLLMPVVTALIITYVMSPLADRLENSGLKRSFAVMVCFGILVGLFAAIALGTWPSLESWLKSAPQAGEKSAFEVQLGLRLDSWEASLSGTYKQLDWHAIFGKLQHFLQEQRKSLTEGLPALALDVVSRAGSVALALIIAFFVLLDGWSMKKAVVALVPNRHFENALVMIDRVDRQISSYLIGTAVENLLVMVLIAIPLFVMGMPNALVFAVIFGAANVIPFAGPFIGASAGIFFSLLDPNAPSIGALVVAYVVVHLIDAMFINPLVMGKTLDMHPLTVIVGISVGGTLGGVLGMLAIIPLIAIGKAIALTVAEGVHNATTELGVDT